MAAVGIGLSSLAFFAAGTVWTWWLAGSAGVGAVVFWAARRGSVDELQSAITMARIRMEHGHLEDAGARLDRIRGRPAERRLPWVGRDWTYARLAAVQRALDVQAAVEDLKGQDSWARLADALGALARVPMTARLESHREIVRTAADAVDRWLAAGVDPGMLAVPPSWLGDALARDGVVPEWLDAVWRSRSVRDRLLMMLVVAAADSPAPNWLATLLDDRRSPRDFDAVRGWFLWPSLDRFRDRVGRLGDAAPAEVAGRTEDTEYLDAWVDLVQTLHMDAWVDLVQTLGSIGSLPRHFAVWDSIAALLPARLPADDVGRSVERLIKVVVADLAGFVWPDGSVDHDRLLVAGARQDVMRAAGMAEDAAFWERAWLALYRVAAGHGVAGDREEMDAQLVVQLIRASKRPPAAQGDWSFLDEAPGWADTMASDWTAATREQRLVVALQGVVRLRWPGLRVADLVAEARRPGAAGEDVVGVVQVAVAAALGERWVGATGDGRAPEPLLASVRAAVRGSSGDEWLLDRLEQVIEGLDSALARVGRRIESWVTAGVDASWDAAEQERWKAEQTLAGRLLTAVAAYRDVFAELARDGGNATVGDLVERLDAEILGRRVAVDSVLGHVLLDQVAPGRPVDSSAVVVGDVVSADELAGLGRRDGLRSHTAQLLLREIHNGDDRGAAGHVPSNGDDTGSVSAGLAAVLGAVSLVGLVGPAATGGVAWLGTVVGVVLAVGAGVAVLVAAYAAMAIGWRRVAGTAASVVGRLAAAVRAAVGPGGPGVAVGSARAPAREWVLVAVIGVGLGIPSIVAGFVSPLPAVAAFVMFVMFVLWGAFDVFTANGWSGTKWSRRILTTRRRSQSVLCGSPSSLTRT